LSKANAGCSCLAAAQSQAAIDEDNLIGLNSAASAGWDQLDRPEPPVIGELVSVYFPHTEWDQLCNKR